MHLKYIHYFGNESSESLLEAYGIVTKEQKQSDVLKYKQCPNCSCSEPNKPDARFCIKCMMVLTYDAYSETLEKQQEKEDKLTMMEERFNSMQSQVQLLLSALVDSDQTTKNELARRMFQKGVYKANGE
jgi:hypothetical protein